ncbi:hypothetical protein J4410_01975 [Candidatus Woesearchaeota archaeon]|nr:hypothetical protein [Candidatus Woesearchaeota archaeon]
MTTKHRINSVFVYSFLITLFIFLLGLFANYGLDFVRIHALSEVMREQSLSTEAFLTEKMFLTASGDTICVDAPYQVQRLRDELKQVGVDLSTYSTTSWFNKKDFDFLKRKYFLLELRMLALLTQLNKECDEDYVPILFFYQVDDTLSERQGFILDEISESYEGKVLVLSFDKEYKDEPLIMSLRDFYDVTFAPTLIIDLEKKYEGMQYIEELHVVLQNILRVPDPYAINTSFFYGNLTKEKLFQTFAEADDTFLKAESALMLARWEGNITCDVLSFYDLIKPHSSVQEALLFETSASLGCGRNKKAFYREAERVWSEQKNPARSKVAHLLSTGKANIILPFSSNITSVFVIPEQGLIVQRVEETWYGLAEEGVLRFVVPEERVYYPNTRFLRQDMALLLPLPQQLS